MAEIYDIDFVRAIIEHELNDSTIFLTSFYEQIGDQDALERYAKKVEELIYDLNKQSYKARGVVSQSGSADIVNIVSNYICPLEYGVRLDIAYDKQLEEDSTDDDSDVEYVNEKVNQLVLDIKGRKFDVIQGEEGDLYVCNAPIINYTTGQLEVANDVYMVYSGIGDITNSNQWATIAAEMCGTGKVWFRSSDDIGVNASYTLYVESAGKLYQCVLAVTFSSPNYSFAFTDVDEIEDTFTKYKVSLSANNIQRDMPYDFNGTGRLSIFFNGQATIVDENIMLGNDRIATRIASYVVEPLEMPSGSKTSDTSNYVSSSTYPLPTTYNHSIENTLSYSFNVVRNNALLMALYNLARKQSIASPITSIDMSYTIEEYNYQFGSLTKDTIKCKIDDLSIANTNGDIIVIKVVFKLGNY